jgi:hypothetical protein
MTVAWQEVSQIAPGWRCVFAHEEPTSGNPKSIISPIVGYKPNAFG